MVSTLAVTCSIMRRVPLFRARELISPWLMVQIHSSPPVKKSLDDKVNAPLHLEWRICVLTTNQGP